MTTEAETNPNVFSLDRIWQAFSFALTTTSDPELAAALGITEGKLKEWKQSEPAFYRAILAARKAGADSRGGNGLIARHVGNSLPKELRELWEELSEAKSDREAVMYNLATRGDFDKQRLLVHALSVTRFDLNACCQMLDISKAQLDKWAKGDPRFAKLWDEVYFQKRNFVESKLMDLVEDGNAKAIIFANERLNREQYGQKIEVTGQVNHIHAHIDVSKLDLDSETKSKILLACKQAGMLDMDGLLIEDRQTVEGQVVKSLGNQQFGETPL
jgi:hypothetical protein